MHVALWREEDLTFEPPSDVEMHKRELFMSTTQEPKEQFVVAIEMELPTIYPVEYLDEVPSGVLEKPNTWFYRRTVNLETATLSALKVRAPHTLLPPSNAGAPPASSLLAADPAYPPRRYVAVQPRGRRQQRPRLRRLVEPRR